MSVPRKRERERESSVRTPRFTIKTWASRDPHINLSSSSRVLRAVEETLREKLFSTPDRILKSLYRSFQLINALKQLSIFSSLTSLSKWDRIFFSDIDSQDFVFLRYGTQVLFHLFLSITVVLYFFRVIETLNFTPHFIHVIFFLVYRFLFRTFFSLFLERRGFLSNLHFAHHLEAWRGKDVTLKVRMTILLCSWNEEKLRAGEKKRDTMVDERGKVRMKLRKKNKLTSGVEDSGASIACHRPVVNWCASGSHESESSWYTHTFVYLLFFYFSTPYLVLSFQTSFIHLGYSKGA